MRLAIFTYQGNTRLGVKSDDGLIPVDTILNVDNKDLIKDNGFISDAAFLNDLKSAMQASKSDIGSNAIPESKVTFQSSVMKPEKIICVGKNYAEHAKETNDAIPDSPILFSKFSDAVGGHLEDVPVPENTNQLDYEAELAVVIGKKAEKVSQADALDYVFGYSNSNDLSARDLQFKTNQWLLGKTGTNMAPMGPYLVTADEIDDPQNLNVQTVVNGDVRQSSNTTYMIFTCAYLIHYISHYMTLNPGDVIMTGTPEGVILGHPDDEQEWLKPGDRVTIAFDRLGSLTNDMT